MMNVNNLEEISNKWLSNKKAIGYTARVVFDEGSVSISIQNSPRKYLKAVRELGSKMIAEGLSALSTAFAYSVAAKDSEEESKRTREFLLENKESLLNLLLSDGCEAFLMAVDRDVSVLKLQYEIRTMIYTPEGWQKWDGSKLRESGWQNPDGTVYTDALSIAILGTPAVSSESA